MKKVNYNKIKIINSQKLLLEYLSSGATTKEISQYLGISENTAKTRIKTLFKKLDVKSREELIKKAIQQNLIDTKKVKPKFRKRFLHNEQKTSAKLIEPLTEEETEFLNLISSGMTLKKIIETMPLSGIFHAGILKTSVCYKLQAKNMTEAVYIAAQLENILKPHP